MPINVVYSDDVNIAFDALAYPMQHHHNQNYFQNQMQHFSETLTATGRSFMEASKDIYNRINSSKAAEMARAAIRAASGIFQTKIQPLNNIGEMQTAPTVMQRWLMANPVVRELYHNQQCSGYADTYVDMHPGLVGVDHYDYRRVMDTIVVDDDKGSHAVFYMDNLYEGDRHLEHGEQVDILNTWGLLEIMLQARNLDPTCPYGSSF